ncbi:MAG: hypothetical protein Q7J84_07445 [Sulfuricaulis sp.]|nr:hypothetical protein [Sulfuricaulis sp.]
MALPYTYYENIWTAQAVTATAILKGEIARLCPTKVIEIVTTGFSGTLDIQGRISPAVTLDNVSYVLLGQGAPQAASAAQLTWTTDTARYRYLIAEPYLDMSLVMTRSAGSVTVNVGGWGLSTIQSGAALAKLAANSGVDVGDVDVTSVIPGVGATNLGKAEDAAHTSGDVGVMALAVAKATAAALGADGDYAPLEVDASGRLHTTLSNVQLDDTDKLAVSLYGKGTAEGDTALKSNATYGLQVNIAAASAATADGLSGASITAMSTLTGAVVYQLIFNWLCNGTNWDRARSIAASGAGLGVQQVGTLGEAITLATSAARTASANGTAVTGLGWRNRYIILFDLTVADTDAGDTLDVYVDVSLDGTTWLNAAHFTQIIGTDAASKRYAVLDPSAPGAAEILVTADAAAGAVRPSLFGAQMRARWAIVDAGTDDASFTFAVTGWAI